MVDLKKIFISAGHSNQDPGAMANNQKEALIATELRNLIARRFLAANLPFVTDGTGNTNFSLKEAIRLAKTCNGPRVELHLNAASSTAKGVEALSLPENKLLAQALAKTVGTVLGIPLRGEEGWKSDSSGQHSRLAFCREAKGVVLEVFFITNSEELASYNGKKELLAGAIAEVLFKFS